MGFISDSSVATEGAAHFATGIARSAIAARNPAPSGITSSLKS
jgi:hypothetical protein